MPLTSTRNPAMPSGVAPCAPPRDGGELPPLTFARLWDNPCWLSARFNIVAMCFNGHLYGWIERTYGLSRPEYVIAFSAALHSEVTASEISQSTGFPKNTLSRAVNRMVRSGYVRRSARKDNRRIQALCLTERGEQLIRETVPAFTAFEVEMMEGFSAQERRLLSELMSRLALGALKAAQAHREDGKAS